MIFRTWSPAREASSRRRRRLFVVVYSRIPALPSHASRSARASSSAAQLAAYTAGAAGGTAGTAVRIISALSSAATCARELLPSCALTAARIASTSIGTASSAVGPPGERWDGGNVVGGDARSL